jgi:predicted component of type VI protein secretion system
MIMPAVMVVLLLTACAKREPPPPQITFRVHTESSTNNGQPFYMLFRMVDTQVFLTETYRDVAAKMFVQPPDMSILAAQSVVPGENLKINVVKPESNAIGIYCLFTDPGDQWKLRIVPPLYDNYKVKLEENSIHEVEMRSGQKKGLLQRLFSKDE